MRMQFIFIGLLTVQVAKLYGEDTVKNVHLIFMNHLDVGYDGLLPEVGFINNILNKYFNVYFPRAIDVATQLSGLGYREGLIYTTHPWLVSLYMNCPQYLNLAGIELKCPNATMKASFIEAVRKGIITWHAGPMNMQFETLEPSIIRFGLQLSTDLDRYFNITRQHRTLSQRDVPGMSQALIPLFEEMGIEAVSVGVNSVTSPPAVPPIFKWQFKNYSVIGLWHPGGYPDNPGPFPFFPGGLSRHDCTTFEGLDHALCFAFRTDNSGPPESYKEVLQYYEIARAAFPNAIVRASTFENFIASLQPIKSKLPVVTKEIGDTWIQGSASDPRKVAEMRALMRARSSCLKENSGCSLTDDRVYNSSRFLLKLGEHTWGLDSVFDRIHWTNEQFYKLLDNETQNFVNGMLSWKEQRAFSYIGVEALGNHNLTKIMTKELMQISAVQPNMNDYEVVTAMMGIQTCNDGFQFQFSKEGSLTKLDVPGTDESWASTSHPLGKLIYQTLNQSDFDFFNSHYPYSKKYDLGIGKFNMSENSDAASQMWDVRMAQLYKSKNTACEFLLHLEMKDTITLQQYGAPAIMFLKYDASVDRKTKIPGVGVELQWFRKPPTRLPEAIYLTFEPVPKQGHKWMMHKLGQMIDPLNVIQNGSQRLHVINRGVYYQNDHTSGLEILSQDVGLVNVLTSEDYVSTLPLPLSPIPDVAGMAFNLYNNIWDVNYIFWYPYEPRDTNQKFRFKMNFYH